MPVSEGVERRKVTTSHGRYYSARIAAQRRKKLILIQNLRKRKCVRGLRISTIRVEKKRITKGEALAILVGTQIGAGVLGLPYAASKVGLIPALAVLIGVMFLMLWTGFIVLKFSAGMGGAQMSTIAQRVLGKAGGWLMYVSIFIMSFGAILAYIAGMGSVFASLFGISETAGAFIFWVLASIVVYRGLEASGKTELAMSYVMLALFIAVTLMLVPHAKLSNGLYTDLSGILSITGVAIFALGCHTVIPDVYKGLGSYEETKKVLVWAFIIPTAIYAIFMVAFLLAFGRNTPQIATQGLELLYGHIGKIIGNLIPLLAITTSYIGIALAQQSNNEEFVRLKRPIAWGLTVIPPAIVYFAGVKNFADVLAFAGDTGDMMAFIVLPILIWLVDKLRKR
ncbi:aromatic amino acid transport family protein [Thermococcus sp. 9N3]|uniref:aromatic amino acid transport family protein n=1 Tax=Thermococcus sp. 9N3 TaxID=163002 RepID=UPI00143218D1|nr:aromatic amino acid transport family protein [Thermococcus sp. 9N3]NJE48528.1 amino acid permease [Thermococcus sp. 9N3]